MDTKLQGQGKMSLHRILIRISSSELLTKIYWTVRRIPAVGWLSRHVIGRVFAPPFSGSREYWIQRYSSGGNSGLGSCGKLARFKARVINDFVKEYRISTVIDFGCGDGGQLRWAEFPAYTGFDVSPEALSVCRQLFHKDKSKKFKLMDEYCGENAELILSLDVIYHLVEEEVFHAYMGRLFDSSTRFVIIYSTNTSVNRGQHASHVKHREFTTWVDENRPQWKRTRYIPNKYQSYCYRYGGPLPDFYIFEKTV